ncbi:hypothetical protein ACF0H5_013919 [Mactra antiquata]
MANKNMFLFWGSGSSPCWKPMIVLAEKGLWEGLPQKLVEFSKKEHKGEDVLKTNPRGQVPTFIDGDIRVNESGAICMYLENKYSKEDNRLIPSSLDASAQVYQRMFESDNLKSKVTEPLVYYRWMTPKDKQDEELIKTKTEDAKAELKVWNGYLEGQDYLCGDQFTMADVFVFPQLAFFKRSGASFADFPNLNKYVDKIQSRPSVEATWPPHWKDSKGPDILKDL